MTYGELNAAFGPAKEGVRFTMVFEDGYKLEDCLETNPTLPDDVIVDACNLTNPKHWGKVVSIEDRKPAMYW